MKSRHVYIPKCAKIDTSDMDHWSMPVGTRFWKEFRRDGVLVETRLIHRYGPGPDDWIFASYQWPLNDPSDAMLWPAATACRTPTVRSTTSRAKRSARTATPSWPSGS